MSRRRGVLRGLKRGRLGPATHRLGLAHELLCQRALDRITGEDDAVFGVWRPSGRRGGGRGGVMVRFHVFPLSQPTPTPPPHFLTAQASLGTCRAAACQGRQTPPKAQCPQSRATPAGAHSMVRSVRCRHPAPRRAVHRPHTEMKLMWSKSKGFFCRWLIMAPMLAFIMRGYVCRGGTCNV